MIALTGTLEKDTVLQVGFVLFSSSTKNWENLVTSLRSIAVREGGVMGCKSTAGPPPFPPTAIFPVALPVSHCSGSSRKWTPSGRDKNDRNWSWPLTRMVLVSGH